MALAAACGQLGEREAAVRAASALVSVKPEFPTVARREMAKWWQPELVARLIEGLRKAGLEIEEA